MSLEYKEIQTDNTKNLDFLRKKVQPKTFFFKKEILRALKRVKRFEFQKTSKRIRNMRSMKNDSALDRLEEELLIIKNLHLEPIGDFLLYTRCLKESELSQILLLKPIDSPLKNTSECIKNVITRLFNSSIVKRCIERVILSLKKVAKIQDKTIKSKKFKKNQIFSSTKNTLISNNHEKDSNISKKSSNTQNNVVRNTIVSKKKSNKLNIKDYNHVIEQKPKRNQKKIEGKLKNIFNSVFLPSLSSGYISGTDDDNNTNIENNAFDKPKKNRRGQRARRKIWEMKYGQNARHLQAKRLEIELKKQNLKKKSKPLNINKNIDLKNIENKKSKPIHASWEAARRLKKKESINIKFEGIKTKFE
ncbi:hypothetical protein PCANB_000538 [Pneumocystis canis]|nr:hypothetical protein PCK1_000622 [Pneumocystis canis]KAG5437824.1 hypothetical protein PCANB_000538 [Pneumocystis canis]